MTTGDGHGWEEMDGFWVTVGSVTRIAEPAVPPTWVICQLNCF